MKEVWVIEVTFYGGDNWRIFGAYESRIVAKKKASQMGKMYKLSCKYRVVKYLPEKEAA